MHLVHKTEGFSELFLAWNRFDIQSRDLISCLNGTTPYGTDVPALTRVPLHVPVLPSSSSSQQVLLHAQRIPVRALGPWLHWDTGKEKSITYYDITAVAMAVLTDQPKPGFVCARCSIIPLMVCFYSASSTSRKN